MQLLYMEERGGRGGREGRGMMICTGPQTCPRDLLGAPDAITAINFLSRFSVKYCLLPGENYQFSIGNFLLLLLQA